MFAVCVLNHCSWESSKRTKEFSAVQWIISQTVLGRSHRADSTHIHLQQLSLRLHSCLQKNYYGEQNTAALLTVPKFSIFMGRFCTIVMSLAQENKMFIIELSLCLEEFCRSGRIVAIRTGRHFFIVRFKERWARGLVKSTLSWKAWIITYKWGSEEEHE